MKMNVIENQSFVDQNTDRIIEPAFFRGPGPFNANKPQGSVHPGSELLVCAYVLTDAILQMNNKVRPIFLEIVTELKNPKTEIIFSEFLSTMSEAIGNGQAAYLSIVSRYRENENVRRVNSVSNDFIDEAFTVYPPAREVLTYNGEKVKAPTKPRKLVKDIRDVPIFKVGVQFAAYLRANNISLIECDRERLKTDFELVETPEKPKTEQLRQRKAEINKVIEKLNWNFINYDTLLDHAQRFYYVKVLQKYPGEATLEQYCVTPSTLSHQTKVFRKLVPI